MQALINQEHNILTRLDQRQYGLWVEHKEGRPFAMEPIQFLTHSPCIAQQLTKMCTGKHSHANGRHASLFHWRSAKAQVYPEALWDAICEGINEQKE